MKKIEKLVKKYTEAQESREALRKEIEELKTKQESLNREAQAKAEAGDVSSYKAAKDQADYCGAEIFVKETQLKKTNNPVTMEEAKDAWAEYIKTAGTELDKKHAAYIKARQALYNLFVDMVEYQRKMYAVREDLTVFCGIDPSSRYEVSIREFIVPKELDNTEFAHDRNFFQRFGFAPMDEFLGQGAVLYHHRSN